ncbi:efflux RND transporter permease subunit [Hyphobacterium sp.]|uniref:efflux RND transporter permease subunit n=1 Tax=Hyphobacterium sp. TaxID=2004662 RepID=UPI003BA854C6
MTGLVDFAVNRVRMILVIFGVMLIAGLISYLTAPKEADPDIPIPFIGVTVPLEGLSPEDAERLILRPAETELRAIEGLEELNSTGALGAGVMVLEFDITFDSDQAILDVREAIDLARREFPEDAREPVLREVNAALAPAIVVQLYGDIPERALFRMARNLQDELEALPSVLEANLAGTRDELLEVIVDPARLQAYGITSAQVIQAVQSNNQLVAAGALDTGDARFQVKVPGLFETAADALSLPVARSGDTVITMADIADVRRTFKDRDGFARYDGRPAFSLQVVRRPGANIIDMTQDVRTRVEEIAETWPETAGHAFSLDVSTYVQDSLNSLTSSITLAIVLVMILVVAALGIRSALLVGIAIPSSFLFSFLLLAVFGYSVNFMVMFAMVLAVGLLVDGAIVVVEYADRKLAEGRPRIESYAMAGKRMFWPIISSTCTTLAAFLPFLFWNSIEGQFMAYLPTTLIFVLSSALLMALVFLPALGSVIGKQPAKGDASALASLAADSESKPTELPGFTGAYTRMIATLVKRPLMVALATIVAVIGIVIWFGSTPHRVEQFLDVEPERVYVFVRARGNLSPTEQYGLALQVEERIAGIEGIQGYYTTVGAAAGASTFNDGASNAPSDTVARIFIEFLPYGQRRNGREILADIQDAATGIPGLVTEVREFEQGPPQGKDIQIELRSNNEQALNEAALLVRAHLDEDPRMIDIEDTLPLPGLEWEIIVDREEAGRFGADVQQIGAAVQLVTNGALVGRYRPDDADEEVDIRVRFPENYRSIEALDQLRVNTSEGSVPLSNFVTREARQRVDTVSRRDGRRVIDIRANAAEGEAGNILRAELRDWVSEQQAEGNISRDIHVRYRGADEGAAEAAAFFETAMLVSLFIMAVILLWQFNNFWHVFLTLQAVVLSVVGVLLGIQLSFPYISVLFVGTGIVTLAGIVVNNNIVLIDTYHRMRDLGFGVDESIVRTAAQRLRPVMLTTVTTICGLLPMVFQINANFGTGVISIGGPASEWWVQLSSAVVWGLGFATLLTLILTPVFLGVPMRMGNFRRKVVAFIPILVAWVRKRMGRSTKTDTPKPAE